MRTVTSWTWVRRARFVAAGALVWAGLQGLISAALLPRGLDRPVAIVAAHSPVLVALALAAVICGGAYLGALIAGARQREQGLLIVACALAVWGYSGGTMDQWLMMSAKGGPVGPPSGAPYWPLAVEYLVLALGMLLAAVSSALARPADHPATGPLAQRLRHLLGVDAERRERTAGWFALAITTAVIVVLMLVLTGPTAGHSLPGQVYFAVAVAAALGVFVATRLVSVRQPIWFWPAPILAGLFGVLVAACKPDLLIPGEYRQLNSIPAWGLARPLPIQMVGAGVVACLWMLRTVSARHAEAS